MSAAPRRRIGVLAEWNDDRGFGFVLEGTRRVFVHISAFDLDRGRPRTGESIEYMEGTAPDGRTRAVQATRLTTGSAAGRARGGGKGRVRSPVLVTLLVVGACLGLAVARFGVSPLIPVAYLLMSVVTYLLYARDKAAAVAGTWRTPEAVLQLAALCFGWPGALVAQQRLRHKNRKVEFQVIFWLAVAVNVAVFSALTVWPQWAGFAVLPG